jgi:AcrR family transcriptional regulator
MRGPDDDEIGLRARKKMATREALRNAAFRLAIERGLVNVRVEDIAAAAGVSPRTYNNYFSSREEAICAMAAHRAELIGATLRGRPADEPLGESLIAAMLAPYGSGQDPDRAGLRLMMCEPSLQGEFLRTGVAMERQLAEGIAERTGTDAARDLYPAVLAAAVTSAARVAMEHWLRTETPTPFAAVLRAALTQITANPSPEDTAC